MFRRTRLAAPVALLAALHSASFAGGVTLAAMLTDSRPAFAQPKPSGVAKPQQDLIARGLALFEDQQYEESIQTLSAALVRPNNTKPQKIEIYRLLALNYITLNRKEEAESAVRGLLAIEPSYALPASESPRFRDFFATVRQKWEAEGRPGLAKETEPPPAPVTMKHASPSQVEPSSQINLTAQIDDPGRRIVEVKLFYRAGSHGKFEEVTASVEDGAVRASIPASAVKPPLVEYYFQGVDKGALPIVSRGDATAPLRIAVPEANKGWVLPVAIGGGVLGAAAIVGVLALAGVFKGSSGGSKTPGTGPDPGPAGGNASVNVNIGEASFR
jgi:hypothetical protein